VDDGLLLERGEEPQHRLVSLAGAERRQHRMGPDEELAHLGVDGRDAGRGGGMADPLHASPTPAARGRPPRLPALARDPCRG
jgi:hypothetical protein